MAYTPRLPNKVSTLNSTSTPLGGGAAFTGTYEDIRAYSTFGLTTKADVGGTLQVEFSVDGSVTLSTVTIEISDTGGFAPHMLTVINPYMRVKFTNGAAAQSSFELAVILKAEATIAVPTNRVFSSSSDYSDAITVRQAIDPVLDEALGRLTDRLPVSVFGGNPNVGAATIETIWGGGGVYTGWLTAASAVRIKAGGNAADDTAGAGARTIVVEGLDANFALVSESITTAGASASSATTATFIRVFDVYVEKSGTYHGSNTGVITIETTGGTVVATIEAAYGQSEMAVYTVPAGYEGYIKSFRADVDGSKATDVRLMQMPDADDVTAPYSSPRLVDIYAGLTGVDNTYYTTYKGPFAAKTDLWVEATGPTGGAAVGASFDLILVAV